MIKPTGNNFGCDAIEIKDYQSEKVVVLNSKITFDPKNEAYRNASVLEIYVPDLMLDKSSNSSCFIRSEQTMWPGQSYETTYGVGTVLTTWIKDKNTICIEKLPIYDELESVTIILATLYVQKGKRSKIEKSQATNLNFVYANHDMYESYVCCVVEEGWCFFTAQFSDNGYNYMKDDLIITLEGFPTDVNVDIFISGFPHQADVPGCGTYLGIVENGVITIPKPTSSNSGTSYDPFIYFFAVRDKE